jgi:hypothetical protein
VCRRSCSLKGWALEPKIRSFSAQVEPDLDAQPLKTPPFSDSPRRFFSTPPVESVAVSSPFAAPLPSLLVGEGPARHHLPVGSKTLVGRADELEERHRPVAMRSGGAGGGLELLLPGPATCGACRCGWGWWWARPLMVTPPVLPPARRPLRQRGAAGGGRIPGVFLQRPITGAATGFLHEVCISGGRAPCS